MREPKAGHWVHHDVADLVTKRKVGLANAGLRKAGVGILAMSRPLPNPATSRW